jgi:hypothetical protein
MKNIEINGKKMQVRRYGSRLLYRAVDGLQVRETAYIVGRSWESLVADEMARRGGVA